MVDSPARSREPSGRQRTGPHRAAENEQHGYWEKCDDAQGQQHYTITPA